MLDPIYDIKLVIVANALEIASSGDVNAQGRFVLIEVFAAVTNGICGLSMSTAFPSARSRAF
jgi:hypothetical protein